MFKQNRKKGIGMLIPNIAATILIFLILMIFFLYTIYISGEKDITQTITAKDKIEINLALLNYLRTPIQIENKEMLVSDLISIYVENDKKYEKELDKITQDTLGKTFDIEDVSDYILYLKWGESNHVRTMTSKKHGAVGGFCSGTYDPENPPYKYNDVISQIKNLPSFTKNTNITLYVCYKAKDVGYIQSVKGEEV